MPLHCLQLKDLIIVCSDKTSSFEELLDKEGSDTIRTSNLQVLAAGMCRFYKNLSPTIETFLCVREFIQLRTKNMVSSTLRELDGFNCFKTQIKK